jgi:hypothetical protein
MSTDTAIKTSISVKKADGTVQAFEPEKLHTSLMRSGAPAEAADEVVEAILRDLVPGTKTSTIYRRAFALLKKIERPVAARYSMRRSLAQLGPSGFPFERFVSEIFKAQGFSTEVGIYVKGQCVEYEIDVIATNQERFIVSEVKFHNQSRIKSDLKVALYVQARFEDLAKTNFGGKHQTATAAEGWLITNTKFTSNALDYARCAGLHMLGWSYPNGSNLRDLIEKTNLQPLTTLTTLSSQEKRTLMDGGIVLCRTLSEDSGLLKELHFNKDKIDTVLREIDGVCGM